MRTDRAGSLALVTLTAPGRRLHHLPDGSVCRCTEAGGIDLPEWNASHSRRWNRFRTALRRHYPDVQFFRGVEVQDRGALHDHAMVYSPTGPLSLVLVRRLAMDAGFGHSVDIAPCVPGSRKAAYYVSKYVTKATDKRDEVPWAADVVDLTTGEVTRGVVPGRYRTWSMSREWGSTMADVRARAAAYAATKRAERDVLDLVAALAVVADLGTVLDGTAEPPR
jgi:hypothetical protein